MKQDRTEDTTRRTAEDFGRHIAALTRASLTGQTVSSDYVVEEVHRMIEAQATTALDALALASSALKIAPLLTDDDETAGLARHLTQHLVQRIVTALETATQSVPGEFTGLTPLEH